MNKNSFTLIELITSITIISVVTLFSMIFYKQNIVLTKNKTNLEIQKIDFLSTEIFIEKQIKRSSKISADNKQLLLDKNKIYVKNRTLYFNDSILLTDIDTFKIIKDKTINITICTELICQEFIYKVFKQ